jgi:hypothetical protein
MLVNRVLAEYIRTQTCRMSPSAARSVFVPHNRKCNP